MKLLFKLYFVFLLIMLPLISCSQIGGESTYQFLNLPVSARAAALGGNTTAIDDDDLNLIYFNPSLLSEGMDQHLLFDYVSYFSDINYGYAAYANDFLPGVNFAAGIQFLNYGEFQRADEFGMKSGKFYAAEYALNLMASKKLNKNFRVGVNIKPIYSSLEKYQSWGLATDIGLLYSDTSRLFSASLVLKNIGMQIVPYHGNSRERLPFEIQAGAALKLRHAPIRIVANVNHLETPDLTYERPTYPVNDYSYYQSDDIKETFFEKSYDHFMRHLNIGMEFIPFKNFYVRVGYNYRRRQEMKIASRVSTVGFSWGFGVKIYKFYLNYGRADYHLAGSTNHFSVRTDLNSFYKSK